MTKMKTHKGLKKRMKVSAKGKLRHKRPCSSHLMSGKSGSRVRSMRKQRFFGHDNPIAKRMLVLLGEA